MKFAALMLLLLLACGDPTPVARAVDNRPRVLLQGAPEGSTLFIDGVPSGNAASYSKDPRVVLLEPGEHLLEVKAAGRLLCSEKVSLGASDQRTVVVH